MDDRIEIRMDATGVDWTVLKTDLAGAYLIDVWTASSHRRRGIAYRMAERLLECVPGQHIALFTEHAPELYNSLGFKEERIGMSRVVGEWLTPG